MYNKLIKYLEENFNSEAIPDWKIEGVFETFESDLRIIDLQSIVEAFKGELQIGKGGEALVDNYNNLYLVIRYDNSLYNLDVTLKSVVIIFKNGNKVVGRNNV